MLTVVASHEVLPGETLSSIAAKTGVSLENLKAVNSQIVHPALITVGQQINIPGAHSEAAIAAHGHETIYDGIHPAHGTVVLQKALYSHPPLTNTEGQRDPTIYAQIVNQFAVAHNPRYTRDSNGTYCNIFLWDVTRAMGAEIPHWVTNAGQIAPPGFPADEITINAGVTWMLNHGVTQHGWQSASAEEAQGAANGGKVAVVMWKNPTGGHGHTAVIRPGQFTEDGAATAQAGAHNFNMGRVKTGFGFLGNGLRYFFHA